ncbi:MAG: tetratricopeptide repeat protein [Alphaproteobacteria bacterium]|nr:tetratricopeptide repeat protein [Alphaproteobacteria bacterium]
MTVFNANPTNSRTAFRAGAAAAFGLALAACQTTGKDLDAAGKDARYRDSIAAFADPSADPNGMDPVAAAAFWSVRYDRDPSDWRAAVNYSAALRKLGSLDQAVRVIVAVADKNGDEPDVAFEAGKALIEAGRAFEAVRHLENADAGRPHDWRILSAFGVALDQIGEHEIARTKYQLALTLAPDQVNIMNNKGLSFAMQGDLGSASRILRAAAARPGADARVRQNLALVLAIKGDMAEAERLARSDLPPQIANGNIEYFRSLIVQPSYWTNYSPSDIDAPDFEADDVTPIEKASVETNAPAVLAPIEAEAPSRKAAATQAAAEPANALVQPAIADIPADATDAAAPASATSATPTAVILSAPPTNEVSTDEADKAPTSRPRAEVRDEPESYDAAVPDLKGDL